MFLLIFHRVALSLLSTLQLCLGYSELGLLQMKLLLRVLFDGPSFLLGGAPGVDWLDVCSLPAKLC